MLDTEELLHLAVQEMQQGSNEKAISHLKACLQKEPQNANAQYLLAAIHAELGMYERAMEEMELALSIDPELSTARFQLGLLYITAGHTEKSQKVWEDLAKLGTEHPLYLFKEGLLDLANNQFESCIAKLKQGIAINTANDALNHDMLNMIKRAETALQEQSAPATAESIAADTAEPDHKSPKLYSLSAYEAEDDNNPTNH